jgi:hypothetical protein
MPLLRPSTIWAHIRETIATESELDFWMRLGLIIPYKDATSSGDHRQFSILNVIEVALAVWLSMRGMSMPA